MADHDTDDSATHQQNATKLSKRTKKIEEKVKSRQGHSLFDTDGDLNTCNIIEGGRRTRKRVMSNEPAQPEPTPKPKQKPRPKAKADPKIKAEPKPKTMSKPKAEPKSKIQRPKTAKSKYKAVSKPRAGPKKAKRKTAEHHDTSEDDHSRDSDDSNNADNISTSRNKGDVFDFYVPSYLPHKRKRREQFRTIPASVSPPAPAPPPAPVLPLHKEAKLKLMPKPKSLADESRNEWISQRLERIEKLQQEHDSTVKELYHLELFQNMLDYKPSLFINDVRYNKYVQEYDMWESAKTKEPFVSSIQDPSLLELLQSAVYESSHIPSAHHSTSASQPSFMPLMQQQQSVNTIHTGTGLRRQNRQFATLQDYMDSFVTIDDTEDISPETCQELIEKERVIRERLHALEQRGGFSTHLKEIANKRPQQPAMRHKHPLPHDALLTDMTVAARSFQAQQRYKRSAARRCAKAVERYWDSIRTHDERIQREENKRIIKLAKWVSQQIKKKWKVVERVCDARLKEVLKEQHAEEGRRHLELILEHSEHMLSVRNEELRQQQQLQQQQKQQQKQVTQSSEEEKDDVWQDEEDGQEDIKDHMIETDDESEDDEAALKELEEDQNLTVEELMQKYHAMQSDEAENTNSSAQEEEEEEEDVEFSETSDVEGDIPIEDDGQSEDDDEELNELNDDANLTVEELMQKYNYHSADPGDIADKTQHPLKRSTTQSNASSDEEEEEEHDSKRMRLDKDESSLTELLPSAEDMDQSSSVVSAGDVSEEASDAASTNDAHLPVPFLLRGTLREYQRSGLDWLASLYNNGLNGILADEMGLGKTIQTISLLAYLACEKQVWGPHLVVVPTSVILNWEMEFKKWLPGFKIMTYYGSPKQRKEKRVGWSKDNAFHVCITSYQLVLQDQNMFRRKAWQYLILDEAHHIKNFRSQRWQVLLNFNSRRRLLLTGTPLQNNLMELWSLLYFLMPNGVSEAMPVGFANLNEFQEWFSQPVDRMIESDQQDAGVDEESRAAIQKLHVVLRPYLLRRLKADVEKQMPQKHEHIVYCRLSKRQRYLYDDFMARGKTRETLASGNFLSIINCLMQLRKVCNHPDLFEERPILTSFAMDDQVQFWGQCLETRIRKHFSFETRDRIDLDFLNLVLTGPGQNRILSNAVADDTLRLAATKEILDQVHQYQKRVSVAESRGVSSKDCYSDLKKYAKYRELQMHAHALSRWQTIQYVNHFRCARRPLYDANLISLLSRSTTTTNKYMFSHNPRMYLTQCEAIYHAVQSYKDRIHNNLDLLEQFGFVTPKVVMNVERKTVQNVVETMPEQVQMQLYSATSVDNDIFHPIQSRLSIAFPDKRLLQYDCGKLQKLATLLRSLAAGGHRALIFTQMTRVLDVLEIFLNMHGHRYLRLDGATKVEQRQVLTEHFNSDKRILCFILSTRSGGLGINLTGADTVIFYDSDWNPSMDKQCQDRAHRIGQTRDVHIYRFVTEYTIEENIFKKANQKRMLDNVIIQEGDFTDDYFHKNEWWKDLPEVVGSRSDNSSAVDYEKALLEAEDESDAAAAIAAHNELQIDAKDFDERNTPHRQSSQTPSAPASPFTPLSRSVADDDGEDDEEEEEVQDAMSVQESTPKPATEQEENEEQEEEEEEDMQLNVGHVDQYMLQFWEREMVGTDLGFGGFTGSF